MTKNADLSRPKFYLFNFILCLFCFVFVTIYIHVSIVDYSLVSLVSATVIQSKDLRPIPLTSTPEQKGLSPNELTHSNKINAREVGKRVSVLTKRTFQEE